MATVIAPSVGHAPLYTQAGTGASPGYDAVDDRRALSAGLQEGVMAAGSFEVTQRSAGANLSVDIAANVGENGVAALVQGDAITGQGLYPIPPHTAVINEAIASAHSTNPRVDRVVLQVEDDTHDSSGENRVRVVVLTGTASSGATLDNLTGAPNVPDSALLLADVHVPATDTTISNSQIRDRRKWARGAYFYAEGTDTGNDSTISTSFVASDAITPFRLEVGSGPVEVVATGRASTDQGNAPARVALWVDGAPVAEVLAARETDDTSENFTIATTLAPGAGSHTFALAIAGSTSFDTATLFNSSGIVPRLTVREVVRSNARNNASTTG